MAKEAGRFLATMDKDNGLKVTYTSNFYMYIAVQPMDQHTEEFELP